MPSRANSSPSSSPRTQQNYDSEEEREPQDNIDANSWDSAEAASEMDQQERGRQRQQQRDTESHDDDDDPRSETSSSSFDDVSYDKESPIAQEAVTPKSSKSIAPSHAQSPKSTMSARRGQTPPAITVSSPSKHGSAHKEPELSSMNDEERIKYLLTSADEDEDNEDAHQDVPLSPVSAQGGLASPTSTSYRNPYEMEHSNSLVSVDWRNDQEGGGKRGHKRKSPATHSSSAQKHSASSSRSANAEAPPSTVPQQTPQEPLKLIHKNERVIYFTESLIPDTSSDSIFIDFMARLLTLRSPFTIHSQIWVTTHRIVVRRFHARDGDGVVETQDEEDVAEHRSDELLSRVSSITIRKESSPRTILSTPMRGWSQKSPLQRLLGQMGVALQTIIVYGPVVTSIILGLLILIWLCTFYVSNQVLWKIFVGLGLGLLLIQKMVSVIAGLVLSIVWYRWWNQQSQLQLFRKSMEEKNAEPQKTSGTLVADESNPNNRSTANTLSPSKTKETGASTATLNAKKAYTHAPRDPSLPTPIQKKKIFLFSLFGVLSTLMTIPVLIFTSIGFLPMLVIAFLIHIAVTVMHILNLFIMIPTYRHSYPSIVKIHFGDVSSDREDFFSLSSSEEQKTQFVMYQILGFLAGCGCGVVFSCIAYLRQRPSNYQSLKELPQTQNHNQVFFLQYAEAVKLRDIITSLREDVKIYPENVDESIVYQQLSPMRRNQRLEKRPAELERNSFTSSSVTLKGQFSMTRQHIEAEGDYRQSSKHNDSVLTQQRRYVLEDENQANLADERDSDDEELVYANRSSSQTAASTNSPNPIQRQSSVLSDNSAVTQEYEFQAPTPRQSQTESPAYLPPHEISRKLEQYDSDAEEDAGSWDLSEG
mmetsp:Transcript_8350/g.30857  ORF Transcript_8350/g.30857 Transcript_8350/m.30857 type:complete len:875 (-) Transcript_8350:358-2982(-)